MRKVGDLNLQKIDEIRDWNAICRINFKNGDVFRQRKSVTSHLLIAYREKGLSVIAEIANSGPSINGIVYKIKQFIKLTRRTSGRD